VVGKTSMASTPKISIFKHLNNFIRKGKIKERDTKLKRKEER